MSKGSTRLLNALAIGALVVLLLEGCAPMRGIWGGGCKISTSRLYCLNQTIHQPDLARFAPQSATFGTS